MTEIRREILTIGRKKPIFLAVISLIILFAAPVEASIEASLSSPEKGGNISQKFSLVGTARTTEENNFGRYEVRIDGELICESDQEVVGEELCKINSINWEDGFYRLDLASYTEGGDYRARSSRKVFFDNTEPEIQEFSADKTEVRSGQKTEIKFSAKVNDNRDISQVFISYGNSKELMKLKNSTYQTKKEIKTEENLKIKLNVSDYAGNHKTERIIIDGSKPKKLNLRPAKKFIKSGAKLPITLSYLEHNPKQVWLEVLSGEKTVKQRKINPVRSSEEKKRATISTNVKLNSKTDKRSYSLRLKVKDSLNRSNSYTKKDAFQVDNKKPKIVSLPENEVVNGKTRIEIEVEDETSGISEISYQLGEKSDSVNYNETEKRRTFSTEIDTTKLSEGERTLTVRVTDQAGNVEKEESKVLVNNKPPEILSLELEPDPANVDPTVTATAYDEGTRLNQASYSINERSEKSITPIDGSFNEHKERFRLDLNLDKLKEGKNRFRFKVKDNGRWKSKEINFTAGKDLTTELKALYSHQVELKQNNTVSFQISLKNRGEVPLLKTEVKLNCPKSINQIEKKPQNFSKIELNSTNVLYLKLESEPKAKLGINNCSFKVDSLKKENITSGRIKILVRPNQAGKKAIKDKLANLSQRIISQKTRRNDLIDEMTKEEKEKMEQIFNELESLKNRTETNLNQTEYLQAHKNSKKLQNDLEKGKSLLEQVELKKARSAKRKRNILIVIVTALIISGMVVYSIYPGEEGYDPEKGYNFYNKENNLWKKFKNWWKKLIYLIRNKLSQSLDKLIQNKKEESSTQES